MDYGNSDLRRRINREKTILELTGNSRLLVENHLGIQCYGSSVIRIRTDFGLLLITGDEMCFEFMSKYRLLIQGKISEIRVLCGE